MSATPRSGIFITHAFRDIEFARQLYNDLKAAGFEVWFDDKSLRAGYRLAEEVNRPLEWCDVYIPVLSAVSLASPWCQEEINAAITLNNDPNRQGRPRIIPVLIEQCESQMPALLRARLFIQFSGRYDEALQELKVRGLGTSTQMAPAPSAYASASLTRQQLTPLPKSPPPPHAAAPAAPSTTRGQRAERPEGVYFTAYHPKEIAAEKWYTLLLYTHVESALDNLRTDARKFLAEMGNAPREARGKKSARLARGTEIRIVPEAQGVEFNPSSQTLKWQEDFERVNFCFRADAELSGEPCSGEVSIFVGALEIASVKFAMFVADPKTEIADTEINETHTQMYRRIFASYSHKDTAIVKACERAFKTLGDQVLIDCETLRSGEVWQAGLERMIDEADIFQLFWSSNSVQSRFIEQEWNYALNHSANKGVGDSSGAGFIRPVYWQEPMPPVPQKLSHLHFKFQPDLANA